MNSYPQFNWEDVRKHPDIYKYAIEIAKDHEENIVEILDKIIAESKSSPEFKSTSQQKLKQTQSNFSSNILALPRKIVSSVHGIFGSNASSNNSSTIYNQDEDEENGSSNSPRVPI